MPFGIKWRHSAMQYGKFHCESCDGGAVTGRAMPDVA